MRKSIPQITVVQFFFWFFLFFKRKNEPYSALGAPTGQVFSQLPQSMHLSGSIS